MAEFCVINAFEIAIQYWPNLIYSCEIQELHICIDLIILQDGLMYNDYGYNEIHYLSSIGYSPC